MQAPTVRAGLIRDWFFTAVIESSVARRNALDLRHWYSYRPTMLVDAHLDLAMNARLGRDITRPAVEQPARGDEVATVGLPDLVAGGVGLVCATIFAMPAEGEHAGYTDAHGAHAELLAQLAVYADLDAAGLLRIVRSKFDRVFMDGSPAHSRDRNEAPAAFVAKGASALPGTSAAPTPPAGKSNRPITNTASTQLNPASARAATVDTATDANPRAFSPASPAPAAVLLIEGADCLRDAGDVAVAFDAGVRIVGLAWHATRYAGGTGAPGPLTPAAGPVVAELDRLGMIHDASHLAEQSFWDLLELTGGPVIASHSNARAIVPTDRQLSDDMIRAIVGRGGVIGINFFDKFLQPPDRYGRDRCTLADVVAHVRHITDLTGTTAHIGIGTDMDGGLGRDQIPREIVTSADLPRVGEALSQAGFDDAAVEGILAGNWLRYFGRWLAGE